MYEEIKYSYHPKRQRSVKHSQLSILSSVKEPRINKNEALAAEGSGYNGKLQSSDCSCQVSFAINNTDLKQHAGLD